MWIKKILCVKFFIYFISRFLKFMSYLEIPSTIFDYKSTISYFLSNFNKMTTKYMDYVLVTKIQTVQNKKDPHALSLSVPCSDR